MNGFLFSVYVLCSCFESSCESRLTRFIIIMSNQKGSRKDVTGFDLFLSFYIEIISRVRDIILELRHAGSVKIA